MSLSKKYFGGLNKKQRIGSLAMLILLASFHIYNYLLYPEFFKYKDTFSIDELYENFDDSLSVKFYGKQKDEQANVKVTIFEYDSLKIHAFDPNKIDSAVLVSFHLPEKIVKNWVKYRKKGGRFYKCEDLKKIYGIDPITLDSLMKYCQCSSKSKYENAKFKASPSKNWKNESEAEFSITKININTADSLSFTRLKGIGPVLAKRIIKYRNRLGGFHQLSQLVEVYGVEDSVLNINKSRLTIGGQLNKINVNNCEFKELIRHFYFDKSLTKSILNYRKQHGPFDSIQQLKNINMINDSIYLKINSYLEI